MTFQYFLVLMHGYQPLLWRTNIVHGNRCRYCLLYTSSGRVSIEEDALYVIREEREEREYEIPVTARLRVIDGMMINAGDMLSLIHI